MYDGPLAPVCKVDFVCELERNTQKKKKKYLNNLAEKLRKVKQDKERQRK